MQQRLRKENIYLVDWQNQNFNSKFLRPTKILYVCISRNNPRRIVQQVWSDCRAGGLKAAAAITVRDAKFRGQKPDTIPPPHADNVTRRYLAVSIFSVLPDRRIYMTKGCRREGLLLPVAVLYRSLAIAMFTERAILHDASRFPSVIASPV